MRRVSIKNTNDIGCREVSPSISEEYEMRGKGMGRGGRRGNGEGEWRGSGWAYVHFWSEDNLLRFDILNNRQKLQEKKHKNQPKNWTPKTPTPAQSWPSIPVGSVTQFWCDVTILFTTKWRLNVSGVVKRERRISHVFRRKIHTSVSCKSCGCILRARAATNQRRLLFFFPCITKPCHGVKVYSPQTTKSREKLSHSWAITQLLLSLLLSLSTLFQWPEARPTDTC